MGKQLFSVAMEPLQRLYFYNFLIVLSHSIGLGRRQKNRFQKLAERFNPAKESVVVEEKELAELIAIAKKSVETVTARGLVEKSDKKAAIIEQQRRLLTIIVEKLQQPGNLAAEESAVGPT